MKYEVYRNYLTRVVLLLIVLTIALATNSCLKRFPGMIYVEGGSFLMGNSQSIDGFNDELPTHEVAVSSFYIGKYEVSQGEWFEIMGYNPSKFTGDINRPVDSVNWYEAIVYCNLLSMKNNLNPVYKLYDSFDPQDWGKIPSSSISSWELVECDWNAGGFRLPSEAEWEFAVRGGKDTSDYLYAGSNFIDEVAWYWENSMHNYDDRQTQPVGEKKANRIGIFDMSGNVWEWCWDWYQSDYYKRSPQVNPIGPLDGSDRVTRGGSWIVSEGSCTVSRRGSSMPHENFSYIGFRVVRSAR